MRERPFLPSAGEFVPSYGVRRFGTQTQRLGVTFVQPIMQDWAVAYSDVMAEKVNLDYQGGGSGKGVTEMTDRVSDFGCSDAPLTKSQLDRAKEKGGAVVHVPLVCGAVAIPYNLEEVKTPLVLGPGPLGHLHPSKRQLNQ